MAYHWKIDECSIYGGRLHLRGWCYHETRSIQRVEAVFNAAAFHLKTYGLPSGDVAAAYGPVAAACRFDEWIEFPDALRGQDFRIEMHLDDGTHEKTSSAFQNAGQGDPYHELWVRFLQLLAQKGTGSVLEIGSRARSGITRRDAIGPSFRYVGLDILAGPNVDVVGDAHDLAAHFGPNEFDAVFSMSVFEHLAMPWKVALEINRVLKPGGIVFTATHQTWPIHEEPWDFWRYSVYSWTTLFNAATGFKLVQAAAGEPASIVAHRGTPVTWPIASQPAFLGSSSIVEKIADTTLTWPVTPAQAATGMYPAGVLTVPPM